MSLNRLRGRLGYANVVATLALIVALVGGGSAIADPVAEGAANLTAKLTKALKLGKQSNKRSKQALRTAKAATKTADRALAASGNAYTKAESDGRFLAANGKAANAERLEGLGAAAFLGATAQAADSDKLDGLDSTAFARSGQSAEAGFRLVDNDTHDCTDIEGPTVNVQVGPSGLVAVYAEVSMAAGSTDPGRELRMQLYEPTALPACETILRHAGVIPQVRRSSPGTDAGTAGRGSWLLYRVPPGERSFSLRAGHTGNSSGVFAIVQDRYLRVQPL